MAGDWIKVEKSTPDKPEIGFIARACGVQIEIAFAAWFRLWAYLDGVTAGGEVNFFTPDDADRISRLPGIGNALSSDQGCGWITFHQGGATIVNWTRHNGESAKQRAQKTDRQRRWRKGSDDPKQHSRW